MEDKPYSATVMRGDTIAVIYDAGSLLNLDIPVGAVGTVVCIIDKFNVEVKFSKYKVPLRMATGEFVVIRKDSDNDWSDNTHLLVEDKFKLY